METDDRRSLSFIPSNFLQRATNRQKRLNRKFRAASNHIVSEMNGKELRQKLFITILKLILLSLENMDKIVLRNLLRTVPEDPQGYVTKPAG
jgi:hypothetical protein